MTDKTKNSIITIMFITILIVVLIINILKKDEIISVAERRKLASFPEFSISKLFDKSFINDFEKYTMDQFINREELMALKTFVELKIFNKNDVKWQVSELGKVDEGGGGTVAQFLANRGIKTIDAGVGVIGMHSPFEITSKFDVYEAYKAYKVFYLNA